MSGDLEQLAGEIRADPRKMKLAGGALAAVVGFALYRRHRAAAGAGAAASAPITAGLSGPPNTAATDIGNDLQGQINGLQDQISQAASSASSAHPADTPRYVRFADAANPAAIYEINNGKVTWLSSAAWSTLTRFGAQLEQLTTSDTSWSLVSPHQAPAGAKDVPKPPIGGPAPVPAPHSPLPKAKPKPAPAPNRGGPVMSTDSYKIPTNGTLFGAAQHFYGPARAPSMLQALATANNIKLSVRGGQTYATVYPGQTIKKA
jgi:hypothetical protein